MAAFRHQTCSKIAGITIWDMCWFTAVHFSKVLPLDFMDRKSKVLEILNLRHPSIHAHNTLSCCRDLQSLTRLIQVVPESWCEAHDNATQMERFLRETSNLASSMNPQVKTLEPTTEGDAGSGDSESAVT
ncbi:hypothetical protein Tco_1386589 [Tanacetum coccineum]